VKDFSATATFTNPTEPSATPWDVGFTFHEAPETDQTVYVSSDGSWFYVDHPEGEQQSGIVPSFDATPGAANTLDLIVEGDTALFGVNGELVMSLALPPAVAGDVQAATGLFADVKEPGWEIVCRDFQVWALPGTARQESATVVDLAQANLSLMDFHASAVVTVPSEPTAVPWDTGLRFRYPHGDFRVTVSSRGVWNFSVGVDAPSATGPVPNLVTTAGGTNALDLLVAGQHAWLGVNGALVATVVLPPGGRQGPGPRPVTRRRLPADR
jgi:hypothetical protein